MDSVYSPVQKDRATCLQTAATSHGAVTQIEIELAPGGGNSLHYHTGFTEGFEVLSGQLGLVSGGTACARRSVRPRRRGLSFRWRTGRDSDE